MVNVVQGLCFGPHAIEGIAHSDAPKLIRVTHRSETTFSPGRNVRCRAILMPPPAPVVARDYNFQMQAYFQGLGAVGFTLGECVLIGRSFQSKGAVANFETYVNAIRRKVGEYINEELESPASGLAVAMTTGDRSFLNKETVNLLRDSGLAHLIAISGLHMGLVGGVVFFGVAWSVRLIEPLALRVPPRKLGALVALLSCTAYLLVSGASVATQRAYIMALIAFAAVLLDRPALTFRSFTVAMIVVTALQPNTVITPGYQMSFAATAALIGLYETWPSRATAGLSGAFQKVWSWFTALLATSVTASFATAPFAAFHFDRVASMSVPANLLVMPIISFWSAPSAALAATASPLGLEKVFLKSFGASLTAIIQMSEWLLSGDRDVLSLYMPGEVFALLLVCLVAFCFFKTWYKLLVLPLALTSLMIWSDAPAPVAIFTNTGEVYTYTSEGWKRWRVKIHGLEKGLTPLSVKDKLTGKACEAEPICKVILHGSELELSLHSQTTDPFVSVYKTNDSIDGGQLVLQKHFPLGEQVTSIVLLSKGGELIVQEMRNDKNRPRPWQR